MTNKEFILSKFGFLGYDFLIEAQKYCLASNIDAKTEIIKEGEMIKHIPFLVTGSIKVYTLLEEGKETVCYYMQPNDSCLMTFYAIFNNYRSKVSAVTLVESEIIFVPVSVITRWLISFPDINKIFYQEYDKRLSDMMDMINETLYERLDVRILNFIKRQIVIQRCNTVKVTHKEIADNLGTSREVVSRVLKKIETEGKIFQCKKGIKVKVL